MGMFGTLYIDKDVIRKTGLIVAFSTVLAVLLFVGSYLSIYGWDEIFGDALRFAIAIPFFCSLPVGLLVSSQGKRLELLNRELNQSIKTAEALNLKLAYEASHDAMTGVLNRKHFLEKVAALALEDTQSCLLLIDVDNFKAINDLFGHHTGDNVLIDLSAEISAQLRPGDWLGRVGGEEFVVLIKDTTPDMAFGFAEKLRKSIAAKVRQTYEGVRYRISVSIGMDVVTDKDGKHPFRKADLALYAAKSHGRNRTFRFEPSMTMPGSDRLLSSVDASAA